jgi:predicted adenine nucleotide alpha hydrolase (AANH) superfamily ATPase/N-acetylglutamate synthase-like GNAT family acetyltransferase
MKLLMHTCCAPCSVYCIDELRKNGIEPTLYWYNPNIHPYTEYVKRKDCLKEYSKKINVKAIFEDEYGLDVFCKNVVENINARCVNYCYPVRLRKTFEYAKANGYDTVTTTLLYSIYQKHDFIKKLMEDLSKEFGINFLYIDFRKGFWQGHQKAIEQGLYMQKYCGCIFSEEQSFLANTNSKNKLPDGFEFLPVKRSINIKKEKDNKRQYIELLLEADPSEDMINKYLKDGDLFVLTYKDEVASIAVVLKIDEDVVELKNIVTKSVYRGKGYAKKMIKYLCDNYKQKYNKMLVGTSENNIPFYVKQGFDKYEKTVKNYFIDNYNEEIWDGDLLLTDMYYYSKKFNK